MDGWAIETHTTPTRCLFFQACPQSASRPDSQQTRKLTNHVAKQSKMSFLPFRRQCTFFFQCLRCCAQYWSPSTLTRCPSLRPKSPRRKNERKKTVVVVLLFVVCVDLVVGYCYCCCCFSIVFIPLSIKQNRCTKDLSFLSALHFSFLCPRLFVVPFFGCCFSFLSPFLFNDVCASVVWTRTLVAKQALSLGIFSPPLSAPRVCASFSLLSVFQWYGDAPAM